MKIHAGRAPFFVVAFSALWLSSCWKNVDYQNSSSSAAAQGPSIVGSQTSVTVSPVSCAISTFFPSYWRPNASETITFQCLQSAGVGLAATQCQLDGGSWTTCSGLTSTTLSGLSQGPHYFRVQATDLNNNTGMSNYIAWGTDYTAPTITSASLVVATNSTASFSFGATDTGGSGLRKFKCQLPPTYAGWQDCTTPNYYLGLTPSSSLTFSVEAIDGAGNQSAVSNVNFNTAVSTAPTDGCVYTSPVAPYSQLRTQTLNYLCNSPIGPIASTECRLDNAAWVACDSNTSDQLTNLSEGDHVFSVRYVDGLGNRGGPATVSWRVDSVIPVVQISSTQVNTLTPAFAFTGTDSAGGPLQSFACQLTGPQGVIAAWGPCTSPISYSSGVTGGSAYTFSVEGTDYAGNVSLAASYSWTAPVTQAPSCLTQTTFPNGYSDQSALTISFLCSSAAPIVTYQCQLNGGAWGACTSSTTQSLTGLQTGTAYSFAVQATDSYGNVSVPSLALTWTTDLTPPTATVTATNVSGTSVTALFSASDTGGSGVASTSCQLDGVSAWAPCTSPVTYSNLTVNSSYTFRVKATDNAGNVSAQATGTFTVTPPPYAGPACSLVSPTAITSGWTNQTTLNFQMSCAGGQSPASYQCQLNSGSWYACTAPVSVTTASSGGQTFMIRPIDANGSAGPVDQLSWNVDTVAPVSAITSAATSTSRAAFTFTASDTGGSGIAFTQCQLTGNNAPGTWVNCTSPVSYTTTGFTGVYAFSVKATDVAGNVSATHSYSWNAAAAGHSNVAPPPGVITPVGKGAPHE